MEHKRLLPTPPTSSDYTFVNDTIQNLLDACCNFQTEMEKKLYDGLISCQKALAQRDSTINNLKSIALQWQTKANESKTELKELIKETEEREKYLQKQYLSEIHALKQAQEEQTNEHLDLILYLQRENQQLQNQLGYSTDLVPNVTDQRQHLMDSGLYGGTGTLCYSTEAANEMALSKVNNNRKQSDDLIQSIYDTVNAMEESLNDISSNTSSDSEEEEEEGYYESPSSIRPPPRPHTPPLLTDMQAYQSTMLADRYTLHEPPALSEKHSFIYDSSSSSSNLLYKTKSCKVSSTPRPQVPIERKRILSMIEPSHLNNQKRWVHRKPIRNSIISSH